MSEPTPHETPDSAPVAPQARRSGPPVWLILGTVAIIMLPFLFWRATWFGRPLSSRELQQYLRDDAKPRHVEHALVQIGERIRRGDSSVRQYYPEVARQAHSTHPELRNVAAWIMGQDTSSQLFHQTLLALLADPELLVRSNAALGLVRFQDSAARPVVDSLLRDFTVNSSSPGVFHARLNPGETVKRGTLVAYIDPPGQPRTELRSPLPGYVSHLLVPDGSRVAAGLPVVALSPDPDTVWEALRALYLVGTSDELPLVENYLHYSPPGRPSGSERSSAAARIQEQARRTAEAIRRRDTAAGKVTASGPEKLGFARSGGTTPHSSSR